MSFGYDLGGYFGFDGYFVSVILLYWFLYLCGLLDCSVGLFCC